MKYKMEEVLQMSAAEYCSSTTVLTKPPSIQRKLLQNIRITLSYLRLLKCLFVFKGGKCSPYNRISHSMESTAFPRESSKKLFCRAMYYRVIGGWSIPQKHLFKIIQHS